MCRAKRAFNAVRLSSSESSPHMRTDCQHIIDSQTAWYQLQHAGPSRFDPEQECVGPGPISPFCSSGCLTASSLLAQHNSHLLITVTIAKLNPALKLAAHCSKTRTRATVKSTVSQITRFPFPPPFPAGSETEKRNKKQRAACMSEKVRDRKEHALTSPSSSPPHSRRKARRATRGRLLFRNLERQGKSGRIGGES